MFRGIGKGLRLIRLVLLEFLTLLTIGSSASAGTPPAPADIERRKRDVEIILGVWCEEVNALVTAGGDLNVIATLRGDPFAHSRNLFHDYQCRYELISTDGLKRELR